MDRGDIDLQKIDKKENLTDPFTKALVIKEFDNHKSKMGISTVPSGFRTSESCWEMCAKKLIVKLLTVEQPSIVIDLLINKIFGIFIISFHLLMNSVVIMKSLGLFKFDKERIYRLVLKTVHDQMISC